MEGLEQCLAIEDDAEFNVDTSGPPASGHDYLRRVQMERDECPEVVVAKLDEAKLRRQNILRSNTGCLPAPIGYAPDIRWQQEKVSEFSRHRLKYDRFKQDVESGAVVLESSENARLPLDNEVGQWMRFCFGGEYEQTVHLDTSNLKLEDEGDDYEDHGDDEYYNDAIGEKSAAPDGKGDEKVDEEKDDDEDEISEVIVEPTKSRGEGYEPLLSILVRMSQTTVSKVLSYHIRWFEATGFTEHQGRWFYALLTALEKPILDSDTVASLRLLARHCSALRASLESSSDERLTPLNLIITLVSKYFDQFDLADNNDDDGGGDVS